MRATSIGHAGMLIETDAGSIVCDPWFVPAFFGSWFSFPRNDQLERRPPRTHRARRLPLRLAPARRPPRRAVAARSPASRHPDPAPRISHPRAAAHARRRWVSPSSCAPSTPTSWRSLRDSRWRSTSRRRSPMAREATRPSSCSDGESILVNQNDCRTNDLGATSGPRPGRPPLAAVLRSDLVPDGVRHADRRQAPRCATRRSTAQFARAMRYVENIDARFVVPSAGPPCVPRRGPVRTEHDRRRRGQHLPRPDRVPPAARRCRPVTA